MKSTLKALAELVLENVAVLEADCAKRGVDVPSLDDPYTVGSDFPQDVPDVYKAITIITAASQQLLQTIRRPHLSLGIMTIGHAIPAAIRCAAELDVADMLTEAGPEGLHIKEIAVKSKTDPKKIGPVMRCLASNWIFREVKPDVFANNRLSSVLNKGLGFDTLQNEAEDKYKVPESTLSAVISHLGDESMKSSAYLYEALTDPVTGFSSNATEAAFSLAFKTDKGLWDFYADPAQKKRQRRFNAAMEAEKTIDPPELAIKRFDWDDLPDGSLVVDVGGGVGTLSMALTKAYKKLRIVVQDLPAAIADGHKRWEQVDKEALTSGRVSLQAHDFFEAQPVKNADVFLLKAIVHDWSDPYVVKILRRLREAAKPQTRLYVMDKLIPYTCPPSMEDSAATLIPGVLKPHLPDPISNMGGANGLPHLSNLNMLMFFNAQERTLDHMVEVFKTAGWKIVKVHQYEALAEFSSQIHAVPI